MLSSGHVVVELSGELDVAVVSALRESLAEAVLATRFGVIAELAGVSFIDASGLGALIGAHRQVRHLPHGLRLARVPDHAQRLLHVTGLDAHLPSYPTVEAATSKTTTTSKATVNAMNRS